MVADRIVRHEVQAFIDNIDRSLSVGLVDVIHCILSSATMCIECYLRVKRALMKKIFVLGIFYQDGIVTIENVIAFFMVVRYFILSNVNCT